MIVEADLGLLSLLPVVLAMVLAFATKDAVFSLIAGCLVGVVLAGYDPATGLARLFRDALGNEDFIWVMMIEVAVGVLIAFYMRAGVIAAFTEWASGKFRTRRAASGLGWLLGVCVFFSDYFSPLFSGPIARPLTDKHKVSREMLAYVLDSGSAPVCTLVPLSGWAVYIAALLQGYGPIVSAEDGMAVFIRSIPYNFYGWLAVIMAGLLAFGILPNFGPMRRAERRAKSGGKVLRDGARPLAGEELEAIQPLEGKNPSLLVYFLLPNLLIVGIATGSFLLLRTTMILEAFLAAVLYMAVVMALGRHFRSVRDAMTVVTNGIKAVLPAILILSAAYSINTISRNLGAQQCILSLTETWMSSALLPVITFATAGTIAFFTGTSWGTYAILTPLVMPLAMAHSGDTLSPPVLMTVGALVGGALFGDHSSPISDTTCLASFGAGSDHMDHVNTQLPYALTAALIACIMYAVVVMMTA